MSSMANGNEVRCLVDTQLVLRAALEENALDYPDHPLCSENAYKERLQIGQVLVWCQ